MKGLLCVLTIALAVPAHAEVWFEMHQLVADDGAADDRFGNAVALDDGIAIVGSVWDDDDGSRSGSAYLFDVETGAQLAKLTATDAAAGDWYGSSVAIDGNRAVIGAQYAGPERAGAVYVIDVPTRTELRRIALPDGVLFDEFGFAVDIEGTTVLIGARSRSGTGAAYLYDITTGALLHELVPPVANEDDRIGRTVALSGAWAVVGAPEFDGPCREDPDCDTGAVHVFDRASGAWVLTLEAVDDDPLYDQFGYQVALEGDTLAVSAPWDSTAAVYGGATYRIDLTTSLQLHKHMHAGASQSDLAGNGRLRLQDGVLFVGGPQVRFDVGRVMRFGPDDVEDDIITGSGGAMHNFFGSALDVDGARLLVGALGADAPEECSGRAHIFFRAGDCDEDFDDDSHIGFSDLVVLLAAWGPCAACPEDLDGDGAVTFSDLLHVLGNWGPCL